MPADRKKSVPVSSGDIGLCSFSFVPTMYMVATSRNMEMPKWSGTMVAMSTWAKP